MSAEVSWRWEPGINRAYVWLTDGTVIGHRDLVNGLDHPSSPEHAWLLYTAVEEWLRNYGVPAARIGPVAPPELPPAPGHGVLGWWRRRRYQRRAAVHERRLRDWRLDHPLWRVPIDPPHGGWRDLVRNAPGERLWQHAASLPVQGAFDWRARLEISAWRAGAQGEEVVATELWRLARHRPWRFVHSVPVGWRGSDIDHVVIGPGGVFTLNTKNHRGSSIWVAGHTVMVNGQRQPYVRNSRHEAERASRLLTRACGFPVRAQAVIVLVSPCRLTVREDPADVAVTTDWDLGGWLHARPQILSPDRIEAIFQVMRRSSTWTD